MICALMCAFIHVLHVHLCACLCVSVRVCVDIMLISPYEHTLVTITKRSETSYRVVADNIFLLVLLVSDVTYTFVYPLIIKLIQQIHFTYVCTYPRLEPDVQVFFPIKCMHAARHSCGHTLAEKPGVHIYLIKSFLSW